MWIHNIYIYDSLQMRFESLFVSICTFLLTVQSHADSSKKKSMSAANMSQ